MRAKKNKSSAKRKQPKFLAVDFFCGAGGTTRGLIDAGGYVIAGIDKDSKCNTTYSDNNRNRFLDRKNVPFIDKDIFPKTRFYSGGQQNELSDQLEDLIEKYRLEAPFVPLMFAICAPCQPFTKLSRKELSEKRKAGRRRDRNLLREACKFVEKFSPELILSENVAGIANDRYGGIWGKFKAQLESLGYVTGTKVVCTSKFGVPQYRKRSILVAARKELVRSERFADILKEELLIPESDSNAVMVSVRQALSHLPALEAGETHPNIPNHRTRALSELNLQRISHAKPGQSNVYMLETPDGDLSLRCHKKINARFKRRCFSDVYTRMHPDRPSPTITTKCHSISNGRFGHFDTKQARGLSLREAAILQSFPEDYIFYPNDSIEQVARMIGNAVPPKLAEFYSRYLVNSIGMSQ
jgi:DNA (cytosine-5)-methyltransferase 1